MTNSGSWQYHTTYGICGMKTLGIPSRMRLVSRQAHGLRLRLQTPRGRSLVLGRCLVQPEMGSRRWELD